MLNNKVNARSAGRDRGGRYGERQQGRTRWVTIAVTRDGKAYLGGDQVSVDTLAAKITDKLTNKTDKEVYLRADVRANYGKVMDVVDQIRAAGVSATLDC